MTAIEEVYGIIFEEMQGAFGRKQAFCRFGQLNADRQAKEPSACLSIFLNELGVNNAC
jgi:hypothetical protein